MINGAVYYSSKVQVGYNYEQKQVVELRFSTSLYTNVVIIDKATAARLINQLRRALDTESENT